MHRPVPVHRPAGHEQPAAFLLRPGGLVGAGGRADARLLRRTFRWRWKIFYPQAAGHLLTIRRRECGKENTIQRRRKTFSRRVRAGLPVAPRVCRRRCDFALASEAKTGTGFRRHRVGCLRQITKLPILSRRGIPELAGFASCAGGAGGESGAGPGRV